MTETEVLAGGFAGLDLDPALVSAVAALGYEEPTPIQAAAIPPLLEGRDLVGQAATGTGKTAAFALPMLQRIMAGGGESDRGVRALVLVPTRELAIQVSEAVHRYGKALGTRVLSVYGGQDITRQLKSLKRGVEVVVATPGRALDHLRRGSLSLSRVQVVVLDEADEMLDMGFAEDLEAILESLPAVRQTALFSATMPPRIVAIAQRHLKDPVHVELQREREAPGEAPRVREAAYIVQRRHKVAALGRLLDMEAPTSAIVFCRTRHEVDELTEALGARGYEADALHGGMNQEQRDRVMRRFRSNQSELLIATDVAARGLDVEHVSHVVNFDVPASPDAYVHRIGRTGRAGRTGVALTLAEPREHRLLRNIEHVTRRRIPTETVPTIMDLRARRLELTRASLEEALRSETLDSFRVVVESLADEFDIMDVAAAAVKLAHDAAGPPEDDDAEIPAAMPRVERERVHRERKERAEGTGPQTSEHGRAPARFRKGRGDASVTRVFIGLGRKAGVRPGDLVGAIANEAGVDAREIGAIDIADRFSLVEVPESAADAVIEALRATTIRGKRVLARRDRDGS